ncbi:chromatin-remodeling ATPase INO80 [Condylostylus longicornis]|uniref:chromatin-remodeling ATPase INO80 n=1 Tax=Condylostylus longicornis TaxID=2530218 RepID=UPI00244E1CAD|nr:chromatin-remodeling ATPase INO80 [Condylostylus longicornis]XP_055384469.1 chromatin-remodeling ATPase INO80 [Condylostylus longicornis]
MNIKRSSAVEENGELFEKKKFANPLHIQRLEASLNMGSFMAYAHHVLSRPIVSDSDSNDSENGKEMHQGDKMVGGFKLSKQERRADKLQVFNFSQIDAERKWLQDVLLSDTESESDISDEDDYIKIMLKQHIMEQKFREKYYKKPSNSQYAYYGAGLLSNYDQFPDHQRSIVGPRKRRRKEREKKIKEHKTKSHKDKNVNKPNQTEPGEIDPNDIPDLDWEDSSLQIKEEVDDDDTQGGLGLPGSGRGRKKKSLKMTPELMAVRRRRAWQTMAKKELGKVQRAKVNNHKEMLQSCKRVATMCMKITRQKAMASQKLMKDLVWRAKRLTREMQGYWKRYDRVERENRRRMEKEAEEQRKLDVEIIEAKRQQRKLNFLITQTELYAHFMSKKLGHGTEEEQIRILQQLDEELNPRLAAIDDYDSDLMKLKAQQNAEDAFSAEKARTQQFNVAAEEKKVAPTIGDDGIAELPQPHLFTGTLKGYQIKGMTWLANLYDQGISGILADEMGLGKTVQSIALLCHIAERYGVWGPFLIISPASTLHNWQQEMQRFVPDFNVVPYWGNPNERKILRQFWEQKDLHTKDASFHVVITSYQLVVSDYKYFNRIKWQYMVLDEAQAIKSSSSQRWKLLLQFNCRNRLLLSGTPIQNSMAELWALLHFIMPTLFDSHDEFNEWFSKDIESHAENKTGIDEKQISRLHMILKPFMLRRIKKDVENELSDKIEIMVYCPLTTRQKLLYMALKKKIKIEDLLHCVGAEGHHVDKNFTSNLMNLVMQFRKVCNHPELFERRDAKSPFSMKCQEYIIPRLIYDDGILLTSIPSRKHLLYNRFSIFKAEHIHRSIFEKFSTDKNINYKNYIDLNLSSSFSWSRFTNHSPKEIEDSTLNGLLLLLENVRKFNEFLPILAYRYNWLNSLRSSKYLLLEPTFMNVLDKRYLGNSILQNFLFTSMTINESMVYTFGSYTVRNMQETIEHRVIRSRNRNREIDSKSLIDFVDPVKTEIKVEDDDKSFNNEDVKNIPSPNKVGRPPKYAEKSPKSPGATTLLPEFPYIPRQPKTYECEGIVLPKFLCNIGPKVQAYGRRPYCESRAAETNYIRHITCEDFEGKELVDNILAECKPDTGWSWITIPDKQTLISDAGKLSVLDSLLTRLKSQGHRVLIYSQMTKMIDLLEEYMWHRKYRYMRLDGSSKISARRDMVADFQTRADIFVFLLSTRAGGLGINLTAADTVIFYDSDWNPTVDQQAMDRAHRLGQTKQVTVYRLICKGTIEERILQRAREKSEIQRMVISGGNFKPDTLKPKEVVSLLLDDEEIELKYRQKTEEKRTTEEKPGKDAEKKRRIVKSVESTSKKIKIDGSGNDDESIDVGVDSPALSEKSQNGSSGNGCITGNEILVPGATSFLSGHNDDSSNEGLIVDCDSPLRGSTPVSFAHGRIRRRHHPRGTKRGRPRGSGRGGKTTNPGRSDGTPGTPTGSTITLQVQSTPATPTGDSNISANGGGSEQSFETIVPVIKRGPGRPRLKPGGPPNSGYRGAPRTRKPIGPLVVPLGQSPGATPLTRSPAMSPAPSPAHTGIGYYQPNDEDI